MPNTTTAHEPDTQAASWPFGFPCGCDLESGFCSTHQPMMSALYAADWSAARIWSESDGYGERGLVPDQGYDWSGIRDSSPAAIERMFAAI